MAKSVKKKKKRSPVRWVIIIGMVILVAFLYVNLSGREKSAEVLVEQVQRRNVVSSVNESGVIEPVVEVAIAADVSGEVVEMNGKEGEFVKQGDLLVTIQPDNYQSALEQAKAALDQTVANKLQAAAAIEQAKVRYLQDSASFKRTDALYKSEVVSKVEWETALLAMQVSKSQLSASKASFEAARYQVKSSEASLKQARSNLRRTNIYATMDGTLTRQNVRKGERVVGTLQMAGTEVLRIADLSEMQVTVKINENDIRFIQIGDSAHVEVDAFEDEIFTGSVTEIGYSPAGDGNLLSNTSSDQITNYEVKILILRKSYVNRKDIMAGVTEFQSPFRPGMSAQVEIYTDSKNNVVAVPIQAVTVRRLDNDSTDSGMGANISSDGEDVREDDPEEVVFLYKDGQVVLRPVKTGINDDEYIVVKEGITEGELIVVGPYRMLSKELEDGMKVVRRKAAKNRKAE